MNYKQTNEKLELQNQLAVVSGKLLWWLGAIYWLLRFKQPYILQQKYQSPGTEFECHFQQANICITEFKIVLFHSGQRPFCQQNPIHLSLNAVLPHQVGVSNGFRDGPSDDIESRSIFKVSTTFSFHRHHIYIYIYILQCLVPASVSKLHITLLTSRSVLRVQLEEWCSQLDGYADWINDFKKGQGACDRTVSMAKLGFKWGKLRNPLAVSVWLRSTGHFKDQEKRFRLWLSWWRYYLVRSPTPSLERAHYYYQLLEHSHIWLWLVDHWQKLLSSVS